MYGYDLSSFNLELNRGLCSLISCLSRISASLGDVVIMYSILSERDTNSVIIFLSGLEEKYDLTLSLILVALPTYSTLPCSVLKR